MQPVYFDNSATTPIDRGVIESMTTVMQKYYGNPSSLHQFGLEAEQLLSKSRKQIASLFDIEASEVIFTSGGTESNNLAIKGTVYEYGHRGRHIITSDIEHSSVHDVFQFLEEDGFAVTYLPVDSQGHIAIDDLRQALREDTILVSLMHVNNELGSIQPIQQAGRLLKHYPKTLFHVDHVQGVGKVPLSITESGIDLCSVSGHKIHGPKGSGFLYVRKGLRLHPLLHGGGQQDGLRSGTENVAGSVGLAKAVRLVKEKEEEHIQHMTRLKQTLLTGLKDIHGVYVHSDLDQDRFAPHIVNLSIEGVKPEVFLHALEEKQIYVSTKSACSAAENKPSRVLLATGMEENLAGCALRISFSMYNTQAEVRYFIETVKNILPQYQKVMKV